MNIKKVSLNKRNKKGIFSGLTIAFAAAAIFLAVVGGTVAYLFTSTNSATNTFVPGVVECEVNETFTNNVKSSIKVKNIGTTPAYMRLCFTTYWVDGEGDNERVIGRNAVLPAFTLSDAWAKGADGYYYCKTEVADGALTPELLATGSTMTLATDGTQRQVVEVFAQAIQSAPDQAVLDAWGTTNGKGSVSGANSGTLTVQTAQS